MATSSGRKRQPGHAHHRMDIGVACQCHRDLSPTTAGVGQITANLPLPVGPQRTCLVCTNTRGGLGWAGLGVRGRVGNTHYCQHGLARFYGKELKILLN